MYRDCFTRRVFGLCLLLVVVTACSRNAVVPQRMLEARYAHAAVEDGKRIFILAGSNDSGFLSDVEVYDPVTGQLEQWKDKLIPRRYFSAVWDGKESIYILGGVSMSGAGAGLETRVEVLNTKTGDVTFAANLPMPTRSNTAVLANGRIFVFGGSLIMRTHLVPTATVAVYDLSKQQWLRAEDMPMAKDTRAVVKDDWIYLVGGYDHKRALRSFERFNPTTNEWQMLPDLPIALSAHSVTVKQNKLLVFGDYEQMASTYSYDFNKAQWQKLDLGYEASRHNAAVTLGQQVYVFGGTTGQSGPFLDYIQKFRL
ncbi:hypothetical protein EMM73_19385 [Rheinheimera sediminis]|uniref:Kelch repeat-containing protein n=1 Tax=Rheinheimera sp. YQF-1 TaxID=2499626 RepID=UPI000FDA4AC2|nr:kelch repeat-containing protein [Rheinheimera sp. YQF-1]RVT40649.1 hypothetical protein EMM73_19385 [Rheinheimera sp. YQF-1]